MLPEHHVKAAGRGSMAVPTGVKYADCRRGCSWSVDRLPFGGEAQGNRTRFRQGHSGRRQDGHSGRASGIACGVIRNNYYQPAMRELMAHSVSVWESDPKAYSYHAVGYMQISPEIMREQVGTIYEQQQDRLQFDLRRGRRGTHRNIWKVCSPTGRPRTSPRCCTRKRAATRTTPHPFTA